MAYFKTVSFSLLIACLSLMTLPATSVGSPLIALKRTSEKAEKKTDQKEDKKSSERAANRVADEQTIRAQAADYAKAFATSDTQALTAMWADDAIFTDQLGRVSSGREAIVMQMTSFFKANGNQALEIRIDSLEFPADNLAIEHGVSHIGLSTNPMSYSTYTAVHVKRDGKWQMVSVSESPKFGSATANHPVIADLAWLIGNWKVDGPRGALQIKADWVAGKNMIRCDFDATTKDGERSTQTQFIFLDPLSKRIRSWQYDFDGGYGESRWFNSGNAWAAEGCSVQADGSTGSARYMIKKLDDNTFSWQSTSRRVLGKRLPDSAVLTAKRTGT
ncbi:MAG: SgcJ/EcaC family oxidoreductase [Candidatus Melainabacteria bacterium]|nr:SgcJ/EcaC family oxidoreductase [Candidatus Melainabacteria bacterium]